MEILKHKAQQRIKNAHPFYESVFQLLNQLAPNTDECLQIMATEIKSANPRSFVNGLRVHIKANHPEWDWHIQSNTFRNTEGEIVKFLLWIKK